MSFPSEFVAEVRSDLPTREAMSKWVIVVREGLAPGLAVNAAGCMAAAVGRHTSGLLGPDGKDASGAAHPGLPWAGCSILTAPGDVLRKLRAKAVAREDVFVVDMPEPAQTSRIYDEYLDRLARTDSEDVAYHAISLLGPRKRIDKLVGGLGLLR